VNLLKIPSPSHPPPLFLGFYTILLRTREHLRRLHRPKAVLSSSTGSPSSTRTSRRTTSSSTMSPSCVPPSATSTSSLSDFFKRKKSSWQLTKCTSILGPSSPLAAVVVLADSTSIHYHHQHAIHPTVAHHVETSHLLLRRRITTVLALRRRRATIVRLWRGLRAIVITLRRHICYVLRVLTARGVKERRWNCV